MAERGGEGVGGHGAAVGGEVEVHRVGGNVGFGVGVVGVVGVRVGFGVRLGWLVQGHLGTDDFCSGTEELRVSSTGKEHHAYGREEEQDGRGGEAVLVGVGVLGDMPRESADPAAEDDERWLVGGLFGQVSVGRAARGTAP